MAPNTVPFLSLCMIVKDEERFIEQCLDSAAPLVDEMVVYDTGSTDRTVELAEARGAQVIRGYWDDDFSRARNDALRACSGTWILWLDADEVIEAERDVLIDALRRNGRYDCIQLPIHNVDAAGGQFDHVASRLFRRSRMHWVGRLHEQVDRRDRAPVRAARTERSRILHHGYTAELADERNKAERNLRIALADLEHDDAGADLGVRLTNVARSYSIAGDRDEALRYFEQARAHTDGAAHRYVLRLGAELLVDLARFDDARRWIDDYETAGGFRRMTDFLRGSADLLEHGDGETLAALDPEQPVADEYGNTVPMHQLRGRIGQARAVCGRWADAAGLLRSVVAAQPRSPLWPLTIDASHRAGHDLAPLVAAIPEDVLRELVPSFILADAEAREAWARALLERFGHEHPGVLAFAAAHAARLETVEQMLPWSTVLRSSSLDLPCPVLARAQDPSFAPTDRFLAAASAHAAFRDPRALELLFQISDLLAPEEEADAAFILTELAPELVVD